MPSLDHKLTIPVMLWLASVLPISVSASTADEARQIIEQASAAVFSPYLYEEQLVILTDSKQHRSIRQTRFYQRSDQQHNLALLVFDAPAEIQGVAIRLERQADKTQTAIYLPATDKGLMTTQSMDSYKGLLGTDLTVNDLLPADLDHLRFYRRKDITLEDQRYYQINAEYRDPSLVPEGMQSKRYLVRQDIGRITRVDDLDENRKVVHSRTEHRFVNYGNGLWLPSMILIEDFEKDHRTLLKVTKRIFSPDYVPAEIFDDPWLLNHQHKAETGQHLFNRISRSVLPPVDRPDE